MGLKKQTQLNGSQTLRAALLAGAPIFALLNPEVANAQCNLLVGSGPLNNLGPNSTVDCVNTVAGPDIASNEDDVTVRVNTGAWLSGSSSPVARVHLLGSTSQFELQTDSLVEDVEILLAGTGSGLVLTGAQISNLSTPRTVTLSGANAFVTLNGSGIRVQGPIAVTGDNARVNLGAGSSLVSLGSTLLLGGDGAQTFDLQADLSVGVANGVGTVVSAGGGNDLIELGINSRVMETTDTPSQTRPIFVFDGGAGQDELILSASNTEFGAFNTEGIETLRKRYVGRWALDGVHSFQFVNLEGGELQISRARALGVPTSMVTITNSTLELVTTSDGYLQNRLQGNGVVNVLGNGWTFAGDSSGFTGQLLIAQGASATVDAVNGIGSADVDVGGVLQLGVANINGEVTGTGSIHKSLEGTAILSNGANTYSGGTLVSQGTLRATSQGALGVDGGIQIDSGGALDLALSGDDTLTIAGRISGTGVLQKSGAGNLTIDQALGDFSGQIRFSGGRNQLMGGNLLGTADILNNAVLLLGDYTLANNISGAGGLEKNTPGELILTGVNTFSGPLIINSGSLSVSNVLAMGLGAIHLGNASSLNIDLAGNQTYTGALSGGGTINKLGNGALTLAGIGTNLNGTVNINAGRLILGAGGSLGTATILNNGVFEFGNFVVGNEISGSGSVTKTDTGLGTLTGTNTFSGGLNVSAGTLRATQLAALGTGSITLGSGATLDLALSSNGLFAHTLVESVLGTGTLRKSGAGLLTLASPLRVGAFNVDAGGLRVNSTLTANTTVAAGVRLDGTGSIIGNLINSGTTAPGNSIGTLNVQGNFSQGAGAVLEIEFDADGNIDLLNVSGQANISGSTLRFVSIGGAEGNGGTFLRANGGVSGTFAAIETVGAQLPLAVIYAAADSSMAPSVVTARPSTFNSQYLAAADQSLAFLGAMAGRSLDETTGRGVWGEVFSASGSRSASGTTLAYDHDGGGVGAGITLPLTASMDAGVALGWSTSDIKLGSGGGGGNQDLFSGSAFIRHRGDGFVIGAGAMYGVIDQATTRNVSFNGFSDTVSGATEGTIAGAFVSGAVDFAEFDGWRLSGEGRLSHVVHRQDGYAEDGSSPLRLSLPNLTARTTELQAGLLLDRSFEWGGGALLPSVGVGLRSVSAEDDRLIPVTFMVSDASVTLEGDTRGITSPYATVGLSWGTTGGLIIQAGYLGKFGDEERHEARVGLHLPF